MSVLDKAYNTVLLILLCGLISGCSTIQGYFPDKEKEYVNSVEIPPLVVPPDLSIPLAKDAPTDNDALSSTLDSAGSEAKTQDSETKGEAQAVDSQTEKPVQSKKSDKVRIVTYAGGPTRLQIDEPYVLAWRIVGKSLSRKSLEIIDRNINDGLFLIQYDPNETDIEDGSVWDEFRFVFGDDKSNEKEYQIRLVEDQGRTEVLVLDAEGTPLSQGVGLDLLNMMHDTITASLAEQAQ